MQRYRTRPEYVTAYRLSEDVVHAHLFDGVDLPSGVRIRAAYYNQERREVYSYHITVGRFAAKPGDWVVLGDDKAIPLNDAEFQKRYELDDGQA